MTENKLNIYPVLLAGGSGTLERVERLGLVRELLRKLGDRYGAGGGMFMPITPELFSMISIWLKVMG